MDTLNEYVKFYEAIVGKNALGASKRSKTSAKKSDPWIPPKKSKSEPVFIRPNPLAGWKGMSADDKILKIKETINYFKTYNDKKKFKNVPKFKTEDEAAIYFDKIILEYTEKYNDLVDRLIKDYDILFDKEGKKLKGVYSRAYGWAYDANSWLKNTFKRSTEDLVHWNDNKVVFAVTSEMKRFYGKLPKNQQSQKFLNALSDLDSIEYYICKDVRNFREAGRRTIYL